MKRKRRKTDEINPKNVDCVKGKKNSPFFFISLCCVAPILTKNEDCRTITQTDQRKERRRKCLWALIMGSDD